MSPFQKLPPELRLLIFEYTITCPAPVILEKRGNGIWNMRCDRSHVTAITRICKQLRHECGDLFYTCNTFVIKLCDKSKTGAEEAQHFVRWFESLNQDQAKALRAITIEVGTEQGFFLGNASWASDLLLTLWQTMKSHNGCRVQFRPIHLDRSRWAGMAEVLARADVTLDVRHLASSLVRADESLSALMDNNTCEEKFDILYWAKCQLQAILKLGGPHIQE